MKQRENRSGAAERDIRNLENSIFNISINEGSLLSKKEQHIKDTFIILQSG